MKPSTLLLMPVLLCVLAACDRLGIPDPAKKAEAEQEEGKAIGGACRHAGRALEDCFTLNPAASKASIFAGWKEMNDYMAENKIDVVKPQLPVVLPPQPQASAPAKTEAASAPGDDDAAPADSAPPSSPSARRRNARAAAQGH
jgi:hypothetical protein